MKINLFITYYIIAMIGVVVLMVMVILKEIDFIDNPHAHTHHLSHTQYTMIGSLRRVRWNFRFLSTSTIPKLDYKYLKSNVESISENIANRKARGDVRKVAETHGTFVKTNVSGEKTFVMMISHTPSIIQHIDTKSTHTHTQSNNRNR